MSKICKNCGFDNVSDAVFCVNCGKKLAGGAKNAADSGSDADSGNTKNVGNAPAKKGFFTLLFDGTMDLIRHPVKLIPTFILCAVWLTFSLMSGLGHNIPVLRFFYTLTYSNGGMFGGFFGTLGGIFGKAVFAAVINDIVLTLCAKKNPFSHSAGGIRSVFGKAAYKGLGSVSPLLIGAGAGLIVYCFFNVTSSPVNCAVAVVAAIGTLRAIGNSGGLLTSLIFSVASKLSAGKTPSLATVSKALTGLALGFAVGMPLTYARMPLLIFLIGFVFLAVGITFAIVGKNMPRRAAAAILLFLMCSSLVPLLTIPANAEAEYKIASFHGRLTYTNGAVNKYGQPFPDLIDFDEDGDIDYADRVIQHYLVHNPDYLYLPGSTAGVVAVAILTWLLGTAGAVAGTALGSAFAAAGSALGSTAESIGTAGAEAAGSAAGSLDGISSPSSKYIERDGDGDLNVTDPATGEKRLYKNNGDGSYTNPLTGATYTEAELRESLESRAENADLINKDAKTASEAVEKQRKDNQNVSFYDAEAKEAKAKAEAEAAHEEYIDKMYYKHGGEQGDVNSIKKEINKDIADAELDKAYYESKAEYADAGYKTAKEVEQAADVAIDVLAEIDQTGAGNVVKDAYAVGKAAAGNAGEVMAGEKTVSAAIAQTVVESTVEVGKNHADGVVGKYVANVGGDGLKATTDTLLKGGTLEEARAEGEKAAAQGGDEVVGTVLGNEITKDAALEGTKALASDVAKNSLDDDE